MAYISKNNYSNSKGNNKGKGKKRRKRDNTIKIAAAALFATFAILAVVLIVTSGGKVPEGVLIQGVDVSGMSRKEAIETLTEKFTFEPDSSSTIFINYDDQTMRVNLSDLKMVYNFEETVDKAIAGEKGVEYTLTLAFDDSSFDTICKTIHDATYQAPVAESFTFDKENVVATITAGKYGREANVAKLEADLSKMVEASMSGSLDVEFVQVPYEEVSYSGIYNEVYLQEVNSKYYRDDAGKIQATESSDGRMIPYAEIQTGANAVRSGSVDSYTFAIQTIKAEPSQQELIDGLFRDVLGKAETVYASDYYAEARASNIKLASSFCNEYTLMPGEMFSYNGVVGERTPERGFKIAHAYEQGEVIEAYGGGICQVSTVIFNAFMDCGKITSMNSDLVSPEDDAMFAIRRYSHMMTVSYQDRGLDATVDYNSKTDLIIRNDTDTPVKMLFKIEKVDPAGNKSKLTVTVMGTDDGSNDGVTYKYVGIDTSEKPMGTKYVEDPSLPAGSKPVLKSSGYTGYNTITHRYKIVNGVAEEDYMLYWSVYQMVEEVYRVPVGWKPV